MNYSKNTNYQPLPAPSVAERAICPACRKPRIVGYNKNAFAPKGEFMRKLNDSTGITDMERKWKYDGYGYFCSLTCGTAFANKLISDKLGE